MDLKTNLERLDRFAAFEDNWNGNDASKFSKDLIEKVKYIIENISVQPSVFPVARDSIQFEYTKDNGDYLEFELYDDGRLTKFIMRSDDTTDFGSNGIDMPNDMDSINDVVNEFLRGNKNGH